MINSYPQETVNTVPIQNRPSNAVDFRRFGTNANVGTSFVSIDNIGIATPHMPSTAVRFEVLSSSPNDTAAGSGARTVLVTGVDTNWATAVELITMNGVTPVQSVGTYYRVTAVQVISVGSYGATNAGNILVRETGGGSSFVQASTGVSQAFTTHLFIPLGYYGATTGATFSSDSGKVVTLKVFARDRANNTTAPFAATTTVQYFEGISGVEHFTYDPAIFLPTATDIWVVAKVSAGTAAVSSEYWGWIAPV